MKEPTPEMMFAVFDAVERGDTDLAAFHDCKKLGYEGKRQVIEAAYNNRRETVQSAAEIGPLGVEALKLADRETRILCELHKAVGKLEGLTVRDVRDAMETRQKVGKAISQGDHRLRERVISDTIDLLDAAGVDTEQWKLEALSLFPAVPDDE